MNKTQNDTKMIEKHKKEIKKHKTLQIMTETKTNMTNNDRKHEK